MSACGLGSASEGAGTQRRGIVERLLALQQSTAGSSGLRERATRRPLWLTARGKSESLIGMPPSTIEDQCKSAKRP